MFPCIARAHGGYATASSLLRRFAVVVSPSPWHAGLRGEGQKGAVARTSGCPSAKPFADACCSRSPGRLRRGAIESDSARSAPSPPPLSCFGALGLSPRLLWDLPPGTSRRGRARRGGAFGSRAAIRFLSEWAANAAGCRPAATLRTKFTRPVWRRARWRRRVRRFRAHWFAFRTSAKCAGEITEAALPTWRVARRVRRDRLCPRPPPPPPRRDFRGHSLTVAHRADSSVSWQLRDSVDFAQSVRGRHILLAWTRKSCRGDAVARTPRCPSRNLFAEVRVPGSRGRLRRGLINDGPATGATSPNVFAALGPRPV